MEDNGGMPKRFSMREGYIYRPDSLLYDGLPQGTRDGVMSHIYNTLLFSRIDAVLTAVHVMEDIIIDAEGGDTL